MNTKTEYTFNLWMILFWITAGITLLVALVNCFLQNNTMFVFTLIGMGIAIVNLILSKFFMIETNIIIQPSDKK